MRRAALLPALVLALAGAAACGRGVAADAATALSPGAGEAPETAHADDASDDAPDDGAAAPLLVRERDPVSGTPVVEARLESTDSALLHGLWHRASLSVACRGRLPIITFQVSGTPLAAAAGEDAGMRLRFDAGPVDEVAVVARPPLTRVAVDEQPRVAERLAVARELRAELAAGEGRTHVATFEVYRLRRAIAGLDSLCRWNRRGTR